MIFWILNLILLQISRVNWWTKFMYITWSTYLDIRILRGISMEHHFFHLFGEILSFIASSETVTHFNWQRETDNELEYLCCCFYHLQRYFAVKNLFLILTDKGNSFYRKVDGTPCLTLIEKQILGTCELTWKRLEFWAPFFFSRTLLRKEKLFAQCAL